MQLRLVNHENTWQITSVVTEPTLNVTKCHKTRRNTVGKMTRRTNWVRTVSFLTLHSHKHELNRHWVGTERFHVENVTFAGVYLVKFKVGHRGKKITVSCKKTDQGWRFTCSISLNGTFNGEISKKYRNQVQFSMFATSRGALTAETATKVNLTIYQLYFVYMSCFVVGLRKFMLYFTRIRLLKTH